MGGGGGAISVIRSKLAAKWPREALGYPQKNLTSNIPTPKYGGSFILASVTNKSRQVDLRILISLCFIFKYCVKLKGMMNVDCAHKL